MSDQEGLRRAYADVNGVHHEGDTLYIAGSRGTFLLSRDWRNNLRIPLGMVDTTPRYKTAVSFLQLYPHTQRLVGHSLGGSVAKNLARSAGLQYEIYSAPAVTWTDDPHSHRHYGDPVSMLDRGARDTLHFGSPHSYRS